MTEKKPPPDLDEVLHVAGTLMRHFNEAAGGCPICGVEDGDHEPDGLCSRLDVALGSDEARRARERLARRRRYLRSREP